MLRRCVQRYARHVSKPSIRRLFLLSGHGSGGLSRVNNWILADCVTQPES